MHCPTCAAELGERSVCPNCGSLPGVEFAIVRARGRVNDFVERRLAILPNRFGPHHFLWLCAFMPLFVLPPAVSLAYAIYRMRAGNGNEPAFNVEWLAIVSAANLILTGLVLYRFHFSPTEVIAYAYETFRSFFSFKFLLPPGKPSVPLVPV